MPSDRDRGFTFVEVLIVLAIIGILSAISTAVVVRTRMTANEVGALASLKVIVGAEKAFAATCGGGGYAPDLVVLGRPAPGAQAAFISSDLGMSVNPMKSGYLFTLGPGAGSAAGPADCNGNPTITSFYTTATPQSYFSGRRAFAANATATVWQLKGNTPPTEPFGAPATTIQ